MNTVLTEEQTLFRDSILKVLSQSHPIGRPMGKPEVQRQADAALWPQAAELGWLRYAMPERLDGLGGTRSDLSIIAEALGRHLVISPFAATLGFGACALAHANAADLTLSAIGGLIGIGLGFGASRIVAEATGWPTLTPLWWGLVASLSSAIVGVVSGFYPAWKASKLDPIEALRYE